MTGIISFYGSTDEHNQGKQIRAIREAHQESIVSMPKEGDFDQLDEAIQQLYQQGCDKLVLLAENNLAFDDLEEAVHAEYGRLFESIEVIPEGFIRLHEQVDEPSTLKMIPTIVIFPFNPPLASNLNGIEAFVNHYSKGGVAMSGPSLNVGKQNVILVNYQPQAFKTLCFCKNATELVGKFIKGCAALKGKEVIDYYAPSLVKLFEKIKERGAEFNVVCPPNLRSTVLADAQSAGGTFHLVTDSKAPNPSADAETVYKLLIEISKDLKDKKIKADEKLVEAELTTPENVSIVQYAKELLVQAEATQQNYGTNAVSADERERMLKEWRVKALGTLGVTTDLTSVFEGLNRHGAGLLTDAVNLAVSKYKMEKEANAKNKQVDGHELIVSHPQYKALKALLPPPNKIELQEGAQEVAKLKKSNVGEKKTIDNSADNQGED
jgi:hypothetical protein